MVPILILFVTLCELCACRIALVARVGHFDGKLLKSKQSFTEIFSEDFAQSFSRKLVQTGRLRSCASSLQEYRIWYSASAQGASSQKGFHTEIFSRDVVKNPFAIFYR